MSTSDTTTPLMKQYFQIKSDFPDTLLLFQVGDFYELFFDDAKAAAAFLGIALTKRGTLNGEPIPLCGVPVHALDYYLVRLVKGGFKIALCDQLEEAQPGKVVQRGVTRVLTPGTLTDETLLDARSASYLCSFFPHEQSWGIVFGELMTAQLFATILPPQAERMLESEVVRFFPDEIILPGSTQGKTHQAQFKKMGYFTTLVDWHEQSGQEYQAWINQQFKPELAQTVHASAPLSNALQVMHSYLKKTNSPSLDQFKSLQLYEPEDFLILDPATQKNLELFKNSHDATRSNTVLEVIDRCSTSMGSRMLKKWLARPLISIPAIEYRQDAVEALKTSLNHRMQLRDLLSNLGDIERVIGRIGLWRAALADYRMLRTALELVPAIKTVSSQLRVRLIAQLVAQLDDFGALASLLRAAINEDSSKEWMIKQGFDQQLDAVRDLIEHAHEKILQLEQAEQQATGIGSLKIRYNQVHGYSIEITKTHLEAVPSSYKRLQTLVGKERYMIPQLAQLQQEITTARNQVDQLEKELFDRIKAEVARHIVPLRKMAHALAHLDALNGLSQTAYELGYTRPVLKSGDTTTIVGGRHPVIEQRLATRFIANDALFSPQELVHIITGPNMGGKSTYLRQNALIIIMAHMGSFVPATRAEISLRDRVFTRIGSGDNLAEGKSTFLVEMEETAAICMQATDKSLIILDEVGRGTSTNDGLAIAQSVVEYIHDTVRAHCLFATHYHELALLQDSRQGIVSYYAASKKNDTGIVFLYTMTKGVADGSFGLEVAKLARMPMPIITRAREIMHHLELEAESFRPAHTLQNQVSSAAVDHDQLLNELEQLKFQYGKLQQRYQPLEAVDFDSMSPRQAFDLLWKIKAEQ